MNRYKIPNLGNYYLLRYYIELPSLRFKYVEPIAI